VKVSHITIHGLLLFHCRGIMLYLKSILGLTVRFLIIKVHFNRLNFYINTILYLYTTDDCFEKDIVIDTSDFHWNNSLKS